LAREPLVEYIHDLKPIRKAGGYEISGNAAVASLWKDDYLLNGVRNFAGNNAAIGVPRELISARAGVNLTFGFQTSHGGLILSIPERTEASDEEVVPMEPIIRISSEGYLIAGSKLGGYAPLTGNAGVFDGRWHELSLQKDVVGWVVSLDGIACRHIPELFTPERPARYLQLGGAFVGTGSGAGQGWVQFAGKLRDVRIRPAGTGSELQLGSFAAWRR
jgi:hypothetical protein